MSTPAVRSLGLGMSLALAYRLEIFIQIASASIIAFLNWSLWTAIFDGRDQVAGRTMTELTTYVVVAWVITTLYSSNIDRELARRYRSGDLAIDLVRPWNLMLHHYWRDLGRAGVALVFTTVPIALWVGLLLPLRAPTQLGTLAVFGLSLVLGHGIAFGLTWLTAVACFRLKYAQGLIHLRTTLISVLSGALIPLDLYPPWLRDLALVLPFQGMSHTPANLFVEGTAEIGLALGVQALWVLLLFSAGAMAFEAAQRRISVQGG